MRIFYSLLFYFLIPFVCLRLLWRGIKAPEYNKRWRERFALYKQSPVKNVIWFHAVSVGEAEALLPLVKRLQNVYPQQPILITTTTPTGSARIKAVLKDTVQHVYLPYDIPWAVSRFYRHFKPQLAVIMETEIWPNLFHYCGRENIPLYVINARLSDRSTKGYKKIPLLVKPALANITMVAAQTQDDADRFVSIGMSKEKTLATGNMKFDLQIPTQLIEQGRQERQDLFPGRFVWLIASTHKGEEEYFFDAYRRLKNRMPELLLLIVPRHPERFIEVEKLCQAAGLSVVTRSSKQASLQATDVYLADTMGELKLLYAASDITFVGGSMVPTGGHNILEPAALGVPVLFGPYMFNFKEIARIVLAMDAAIQCQDLDDIVRSVTRLYQKPDLRAELKQRGLSYLRQNQGAIDKILFILEQNLNKR